MKFYPGVEVLPEGFGSGMFFHLGAPEEHAKSPLATMLLEEDGIKSVFLGKDFVTVTKQKEDTWYVSVKYRIHTN